MNLHKKYKNVNSKKKFRTLVTDEIDVINLIKIYLPFF